MTKFIRIIALLTVFVLMLSAAGCVTVGFGNRVTGGVQGSGVISTTGSKCDDFSKLTIKIPGELYYTVGEASVKVELHENLLQYLTISHNNGAVIIDSDRDFSVENKQNMPKIYVSTPLPLENLRIEGVVDIKEADKITADSFKLTVDGVFSGTLDLDVKNLNVDMSGVGDLTLNGTADNAKIDVSGVGSLKAFGLQIKEADVDTSGVGDVEINCSDKLTADISSVGGVRYKGNPAVYPNVSGVGGLKKVD